MARICGVTDAAMRQHLEQLEIEGLICRDTGSSSSPSRGRPAVRWILDPTNRPAITGNYPQTFPDRHQDLAVDLLAELTETLGSEATTKVLERRGERLTVQYRSLVRDLPLAEKVQRLASARDDEGYRAEVIAENDGSFTLIEHHCAIARAAEACRGLCESELDVFRATLDSAATVERVQFAPAGDGRCSYRITPR